MRSTQRAAFGLALALGVATVLAAAFSVTSVHAQTAAGVTAGTFTFSESGTLVGNQGITSIGLLKLDGKGNVTGNETIHTPSGTLQAVVTGTYQTAADGTGSMSLSLTLNDDNSTMVTNNYEFVTASAGKMIHAQRVDPGVVSSVTVEQQ